MDTLGRPELLNDLEALQLQGEGIRKAIGFSTTIMKLRKGAHATEVGSDNPTRLDQSADVLVRMKSELTGISPTAGGWVGTFSLDTASTAAIRRFEGAVQEHAKQSGKKLAFVSALSEPMEHNGAAGTAARLDTKARAARRRLCARARRAPPPLRAPATLLNRAPPRRRAQIGEYASQILHSRFTDNEEELIFGPGEAVLDLYANPPTGACDVTLHVRRRPPAPRAPLPLRPRPAPRARARSPLSGRPPPSQMMGYWHDNTKFGPLVYLHAAAGFPKSTPASPTLEPTGSIAGGEKLLVRGTSYGGAVEEPAVEVKPMAIENNTQIGKVRFIPFSIPSTIEDPVLVSPIQTPVQSAEPSPSSTPLVERRAARPRTPSSELKLEAKLEELTPPCSGRSSDVDDVQGSVGDLDLGAEGWASRCDEVAPTKCDTTPSKLRRLASGGKAMVPSPLGKSGPVGRTLLDEAGEAVGAAARAIGGAAALAIGGPAARCSEVARTSARAIDF